MSYGPLSEDVKVTDNSAVLARPIVDSLIPISYMLPDFKELRRGWIVPKDSAQRGHYGWDLPVVTGSPVRSVGEGEITLASYGSNGGYGNIVRVLYPDSGVELLFAHLHRIFVRGGDRVLPGQMIAKTGNTGRSKGPHLHLELYHFRERIDPSRLFKIA
jgi:murein DD-endopeptidase MepM/ murein hydrolase activator NlpD